MIERAAAPVPAAPTGPAAMTAPPARGATAGAARPDAFEQALVRAGRSAAGPAAGPAAQSRPDAAGAPEGRNATDVGPDEDAPAAQDREAAAAIPDSDRSTLSLALLDTVSAPRSGEDGAGPGAARVEVSAGTADGPRGSRAARHRADADASQAGPGPVTQQDGPSAPVVGLDAATPVSRGFEAAAPGTGAAGLGSAPGAGRPDRRGDERGEDRDDAGVDARGVDAASGPQAVPQADDETSIGSAGAGSPAAADPLGRALAGEATLPVAEDGRAPSSLSRSAEAAQPAAFADAAGTVHRPGAVAETPAAAGPAFRSLVAEPLASPGFGPALAGEVDRLLLQGAQSAELLVTPRALGPIRIELSMSGETASVAFSAIQPETRQAIEQSLPLLRAMLAEHGLELGQAEVGSGQDRQDGRAAGPGAAADASPGAGPAAAPDGDRNPPYGTRSRGLVDLFA